LISEIPVIKSIEPFIMFDLPETHIEPLILGFVYDRINSPSPNAA